MQRWDVQSCAMGYPLLSGAVEFYLQLLARRESTGSWDFLMHFLACPAPAFGKAEARGCPMFCASPSPKKSPEECRDGYCSAPVEEERDGIPQTGCAVLLSVTVPAQGRLCCFLNKVFNP